MISWAFAFRGTLSHGLSNWLDSTIEPISSFLISKLVVKLPEGNVESLLFNVSTTYTALLLSDLYNKSNSTTSSLPHVNPSIFSFLTLLDIPTLWPSEETYLNLLGINATSVKGENVEYSLSMYFHLYANLGNTYSNKGSFSSKTTSHNIASKLPPSS